MMNVASALAVVIKVPPQAILPLAIAGGVLLVLLFAGAALASWKERSPSSARTVGTICGVLLSGYALYAAFKLVPNKYIDLGPYDHPPISLADGPILGFTALMATIMWGFAGRPKIGLAFGGLVGLALIVKPFVMPFVTHFSDGAERQRVISDPDTMSIVGPGVAVLITALIVGLRQSGSRSG